MVDSEMRAAMELQIKEFGQTPKQLFRHPHPKRLLSQTKSVRPIIDNISLLDQGNLTQLYMDTFLI